MKNILKAKKTNRTSRFKRQIAFCISDQTVASFSGSSHVFVSCVGDPCADIVLHLNSLHIILFVITKTSFSGSWLSYIIRDKISTQLNTSGIFLHRRVKLKLCFMYPNSYKA